MRSYRQLATGFTLIEMMVVVVIISIVSVSAIVLVIPDGRSKLRTEAQRFESLYDLLYEESLIQGQVRGIAVSRSGYSFYQRSRTGAWQLMHERPFVSRPLLEDFRIELTLDGVIVYLDDTMPSKPQLWLSPSGMTRPFTMQFVDRYGEKTDQQTRVDSLGRRSWHAKAS